MRSPSDTKVENKGTRSGNLTLLLRRPNFYISIHSQSLRCVGNFLGCAREKEKTSKRKERAKREREKEREFLLVGDTREERARRKFENSRKHCSGKPAHGNKHTLTRVYTYVHIYSRRIHSECCTAPSRAGSEAVRDPSTRRSEINYGVSGGRGTPVHPVEAATPR